MQRQRLLVGDPLIGRIRSDATQLGVDPGAAEAVAYSEGGFQGAVGDHGTSFGPFQLHQGGALPSGLSGAAARVWANSVAGVDYALGRIAAVAKGLKGPAAVDAIVTRFERPADGGTADKANAAAYMRTNRRGGRTVTWTGVSLAGVNPSLIADVAAAATDVGAVAIDVTSGKRAPGPGNDVKNSNHITGNALDGYAVFKDGRRVPLGTALKPVAGRYGLRSGDVAGFDPQKPGGYDPVHVDNGANGGGADTATPVRTRPDTGGGSGVTPWLEAITGGPVTLAEQGFASIFGGGVGGIADVFKGAIWLMNPRSWLRMVEFVTGTLLMLLGFVGLAVVFLRKSETVGKAAGLASALPGPAGVAGRRAVTAVRTVGRGRTAPRPRPPSEDEQLNQEQLARERYERANRAAAKRRQRIDTARASRDNAARERDRGARIRAGRDAIPDDDIPF